MLLQGRCIIVVGCERCERRMRLWVGVERRLWVLMVFIRNVDIHNFASLDGRCRRRGCRMDRVRRYLNVVVSVVWVVKGRSAAGCAGYRGRDAFTGRGRCARVLSGKGAAEYFAYTLETQGGPFLGLGRRWRV